MDINYSVERYEIAKQIFIGSMNNNAKQSKTEEDLCDLAEMSLEAAAYFIGVWSVDPDFSGE